MARLAWADGTTTLVATPHQLGTYGRTRGDAIRAQTDRFRRRLEEAGIPLTVLPGAEIRVEPDLLPRLRRGDLLTLGDHRRHVLLELPHDVYLPLDRIVSELSQAGIVAILGHPERNAGLLARPEILAPLVRAGCLLQITAGSLLGSFGREVQQLAVRLVEQGLVHFVASDAHGANSRRPLLGKAYEATEQLAGEETAMDLFCRNPGCVAAGQPLPGAGGRLAGTSRGGSVHRWFSRRKSA